jgi:DNA polymerase type B, organellar and viral
MIPIYTFDVETDPFKHGRVPKAFCCGLFDGENYVNFWGENCIAEMMTTLENMPPGILYAHNGGRFDFFYIMRWILGSEMRIINSRIIKAEIEGVYGKHEVRDSYAIMPFALGSYKGEGGKKDIEIWKLEKRSRNKHRIEILDYLKRDCTFLWELVTKFSETFGLKTLTVGTASMKELKKVHSFENLDSTDDADIRKNYYYGGRVECFRKGIIKAKKGTHFRVYDVNSMYPFAMKSFQHPVGKATHESRDIEESTMFLSVTGYNRGAFPSVTKGKIMFDRTYGQFHITRHEFDVATEYGLFDLESIQRCVNYDGRTATFEAFVDKFYNLRLDARAEKDEIMALFYKFILNSAYGKFGQNPENYKEYTITDSSTDLRESGWEPESIEYGDAYVVWSKPTRDTSRYNVATGASITGAARSILLRGIATAKEPLYCDTDSILCSDLPIARKDSIALGAWKEEAKFDSCAIAGRKLYALFDGEECVKKANKGVAVTPIDIWNICCGDVIQSKRDAPSFKLDGSHRFISRKVRMT